MLELDVVVVGMLHILCQFPVDRAHTNVYVVIIFVQHLPHKLLHMVYFVVTDAHHTNVMHSISVCCIFIFLN